MLLLSRRAGGSPQTQSLHRIGEIIRHELEMESRAVEFILIYQCAIASPDQHSPASGRGARLKVARPVSDHPGGPKVEAPFLARPMQHPRLRFAALAFKPELGNFGLGMVGAELECVDRSASLA